MILFADLFLKVERTTKTTAKIKALVDYFNLAPDTDKVWTIAIFSHKRPKRSVSTSQLRLWASEKSGIPQWLFEDSYHIVGDLAETIAKVVPGGETETNQSLSYWINYIKDLKDLDDDLKKSKIFFAWENLNFEQRFLFNKIITGGFRMGISQKTIVKALSKHLGQEENTLAHKLMGDWDPASISFEDLLLIDDPRQNLSKPYPFYLAYALDKHLDELGNCVDWMAEYKWDGIRGQLIHRESEIYLWSRGEELITHQFPEFKVLVSSPRSFVIDGELLIKKPSGIGSFNDLQKRLGRKTVSKKMLSESPAFIMAYDLLELDGEDLRETPQSERRRLLEIVIQENDSFSCLDASSRIKFSTWDELTSIREGARIKKAEGLMLKSMSASYKTGRKKGDWYKWKLDPFTIDAVMLYAQRGHGRRSNMFTDFTFALMQGENLVTFAKAYSGLTDEEFLEIIRFVRKNTKERFGPVHSVVPELVFEIAFENVSASKRHKSGVAVRFPRILRWRKDKALSEINTLEDLKNLIQ